MTPVQEWFFHHFGGHPQRRHFNQSVMLYRREGFEETVVRKVFTAVVEHHDALRMRYRHKENGMHQENRGLKGRLFDLEVFEPEGESDTRARVEKGAQRLQTGIDLEKGPLVKLGLFKTGEGDHLSIVIHHLVMDGVSWRILLEDIAAAYGQAARGEHIQLPLKTDSFKNRAEGLNRFAGSRKLLKQLGYWAEVEKTTLPPVPKDREIDREKRVVENMETVTMTLDETLTTALVKQANRAYNTEINDLLLAALALALGDWRGLDPAAVNLEGHGREDIGEGLDISRTVGWFTSQYPFILGNGNSDQLPYHIKTVKEALRRVPGKGTGYGILKYLTPPGKKKGTSFHLEPAINFNYLGQFGEEKENSVFRVSPFSPGKTVSPSLNHLYAVDINGMIRDGVLGFTFGYNRFEFERESMEKLAGAYRSRLIQIIGHCVGKRDRELTPADVGWSRLSLEEFDTVKKHVEQEVGEGMEIDRVYPLSPMQAGMFYHWSRSESTAAYFAHNIITLRGRLDTALLERSLDMLMERHEVFRAVFISRGLRAPLQVVLKKRSAHIDCTDITHLAENERERYIDESIERNMETGVDLSTDIPAGISVFKTGEDTWKLVWRFHHIIMDGWCTGIIFKDLLHAYRSLKEGKPVEFAPVTPYRNYIRWLVDRDKDEGLHYWRQYLEGYLQPAGFRDPGKVPGAKGYRMQNHRFALGEGLTHRLNDIAVGNRVTVNCVFQTLWGILLQKYNDTADVVFGAVVSGRSPEVEGIENMVGLFINTVPVRIKKEAGQTFSQLLRQIQHKEIASKSREYVPLAEIQVESPLKGQLFDHIVAFENFPIREVIKEAGGAERIGFTFESLRGRDQTNYNLNVIVVPGDSLGVTFTYNSLVYGEAFISRLAGHFTGLAAQAAEQPDNPLPAMSMLSEKEKVGILSEANAARGEEDYDFD